MKIFSIVLYFQQERTLFSQGFFLGKGEDAGRW
jgi:hypothetical protein